MNISITYNTTILKMYSKPTQNFIKYFTHIFDLITDMKVESIVFPPIFALANYKIKIWIWYFTSIQFETSQPLRILSARAKTILPWLSIHTFVAKFTLQKRLYGSSFHLTFHPPATIIAWLKHTMANLRLIRKSPIIWYVIRAPVIVIWVER